MFVVFADIWKSYGYTYCTKTALKEMLIKKNITQRNFLLVEFSKFLDGVLSSI